MNRNTASILILTILIAVTGGLGLWYYLSKEQIPSGEEKDDEMGENVSPFGTPGTKPVSSGEETGATEESKEVPVIRQVSEQPVAGFTIIEKKNASSTIRYIEQATGHIFDASVRSNLIERVSNTTIPGVREAFFGSTGDTLIIRYLRDDGETIASFTGKIKRATTTEVGELTGEFLQDSIETVAQNQIGTKLFYLTSGNNGATGFTSNVDGTKPVKIFSSPLREWLATWLNDTDILLSTKASGSSLGVIQVLSTKSGEIQNITSGNGVTATGKSNIVIYKTNNGAMGSFDLRNGSEKILSVPTLPEKCALTAEKNPILLCGVPKGSISGNYPDIWYQGLVNFSDDLWNMDLKSEEARLVIDFENAGKRFDITSPKITSDGAYFCFINKIDGTLWSVKLK